MLQPQTRCHAALRLLGEAEELRSFAGISSRGEGADSGSALSSPGGVLRGSSPAALVLLPAIGAVLGVFFLDRRITRQATRRRARIEEQLPDVAELLAFAVAAGESMIPALHRVSGMIRETWATN